MRGKPSKEDVKKYYREINKFLNTKYKEGLKEVLKSGRFQELMKIRNLSYAYSIYNTILIISQRPEILEKGGLVLPRYKWKKLGREINKDAQPIWIWRPNPKKIYEVQKEPIPEELKKYEEIAKNKKFEEFKKEIGKEDMERIEKCDGENLKNFYYDLKQGYRERRIERDEKI